MRSHADPRKGARRATTPPPPEHGAFPVPALIGRAGAGLPWPVSRRDPPGLHRHHVLHDVRALHAPPIVEKGGVFSGLC